MRFSTAHGNDFFTAFVYIQSHLAPWKMKSSTIFHITVDEQKFTRETNFLFTIIHGIALKCFVPQNGTRCLRAWMHVIFFRYTKKIVNEMDCVISSHTIFVQCIPHFFRILFIRNHKLNQIAFKTNFFSFQFAISLEVWNFAEHLNPIDRTIVWVSIFQKAYYKMYFICLCSSNIKMKAWTESQKGSRIIWTFECDIGLWTMASQQPPLHSMHNECS